MSSLTSLSIVNHGECFYLKMLCLILIGSSSSLFVMSMIGFWFCFFPSIIFTLCSKHVTESLDRTAAY